VALTKVRRGGTDTGISDSSDATAITIDNSENITTTNAGIITAGRFINGTSSNDPWLKGVNSSGTETFFVKPDGTSHVKTSLLVGTTNSDIASTSGTGNEGHVFTAGTAGQHAISNSVCLDLNRKTSNGVIVRFRKDGSTVGTISTNANSLPSDKNVKKDIKDLNIGLDLVSQLQPKSFNLIVDDANTPVMYGLVAQDLEIALEKVGVTKNSAWILQHEEKNDAKESDYSLDYGKLIPILINAIKELQARITALESK